MGAFYVQRDRGGAHTTLRRRGPDASGPGETRGRTGDGLAVRPLWEAGVLGGAVRAAGQSRGRGCVAGDLSAALAQPGAVLRGARAPRGGAARGAADPADRRAAGEEAAGADGGGGARLTVQSGRGVGAEFDDG